MDDERLPNLSVMLIHRHVQVDLDISVMMTLLAEGIGALTFHKIMWGKE